MFVFIPAALLFVFLRTPDARNWGQSVAPKIESEKYLNKHKSLNKLYDDISEDNKNLNERNINLLQQMDNFNFVVRKLIKLLNTIYVINRVGFSLP